MATKKKDGGPARKPAPGMKAAGKGGGRYATSTDRRCKTSDLEERILTAIEVAGVDLVRQVKRGRWVFDGAVQDSKILIEVNGNFWHDKPDVVLRDKKKNDWAERNGYVLLTILEAAATVDFDGAVDRVVRRIRAILSEPERPVEKFTPKTAYRGAGDWAPAFLATLAETGNKREACRAAGVSRTIAYQRRDHDKAFAADWDDAEEDAADALELEARRRALEQSDTLIQFLLRALRPSKFREQVSIRAGAEGAPGKTYIDIRFDEI